MIQTAREQDSVGVLVLLNRKRWFLRFVNTAHGRKPLICMGLCDALVIWCTRAATSFLKKSLGQGCSECTRSSPYTGTKGRRHLCDKGEVITKPAIVDIVGFRFCQGQGWQG